MATATCTTSFSSAVYFSNHPEGTLSSLSTILPSGATVTKVEFRVYCGVSTDNYEADTNFYLYDTSGNYITIEDTTDTGSSNRIWAEFGGTPDKQIDWNNLSYIELWGTNKLTVRTGYTATLTLTYTEPTWNSGPSISSITQQNDGSFKITWSAADWSGGNSTISYEIFIYEGSTKIVESDYLTNGILTYTADIPKYSTSLSFFVRARPVYTSTNYIDSNSVSKTFNPPSLSTPTISISPTSGNTTIVTRSNSTLSHTDGTITYTLKQNGNTVDNFSGTSYTVTETQLESWGNTSVVFTVVATATGLTNTYSGDTLTKTSSGATFTYEPYKTILYYDGSNWVECIPYYYDGTTWQECEPYYYDGSNWQICSYT